MTVVDASIVVRLLLNRAEDGPLRDRFVRERRLAAPTLIDAEVTSAIRGLMMTSRRDVRIGEDRVAQMLGDHASLPIDRFPLVPLQPRVLTLRENFTAYDAFYVALAEALDEPLLTDDTKFEAAPLIRARVDTWP